MHACMHVRMYVTNVNHVIYVFIAPGHFLIFYLYVAENCATICGRLIHLVLASESNFHGSNDNFSGWTATVRGLNDLKMHFCFGRKHPHWLGPTRCTFPLRHHMHRSLPTVIPQGVRKDPHRVPTGAARYGTMLPLKVEKSWNIFNHKIWGGLIWQHGMSYTIFPKKQQWSVEE